MSKDKQQNILKKVRQNLEEYYKNKDIIENKGSFIKKLEKINKRLSSKQEELKKCEEFILNLFF